MFIIPSIEHCHRRNMETYQTLSLIGCIFGLLLSIGLMLVMGFLVGTSDVFFNMSRPTQQERVEHEASQSSVSPFIGGLALSFILYIAILVITFAVKAKTKTVGIILLVLGVITTVITNGWGIIPFALLLPAGIVALRYKPKEITKQP
jgi:hypothetical protein